MTSKGRRPILAEERTLTKRFGSRLRVLRIARGFTQKEVADAAGLGSYQQYHKFERGVNRMSIVQAAEVAAVFGVPVTDLFDPAKDFGEQELLHREHLEIIKSYNKMTEKQKIAFANLARAIVSDE